MVFFFKQKTAYEMRISDWSSDVCSSDLGVSVEGDRVFATSGLGDVAALNASSGSVIWKKRPGGPLRGSPTLSNGNVYVVSPDNPLFALNAENGYLGWTESCPLEITRVFGLDRKRVVWGKSVSVRVYVGGRS